MADKPIIFSAPMVRALLDGTKTQTRRAFKPQPDALPNGFASLRLSYNIGDRLWVREAVTWVSAWGWRYRADNDDLTEKREAGEVGKWAPSIHMPRHASRLTLTITDVRVQQLHEVTEADALAVAPPPRMIDGDAGPVVLNTPENRAKLRKAALKIDNLEPPHA